MRIHKWRGGAHLRMNRIRETGGSSRWASPRSIRFGTTLPSGVGGELLYRQLILFLERGRYSDSWMIPTPPRAAELSLSRRQTAQENGRREEMKKEKMGQACGVQDSLPLMTSPSRPRLHVCR